MGNVDVFDMIFFGFFLWICFLFILSDVCIGLVLWIKFFLLIW